MHTFVLWFVAIASALLLLIVLGSSVYEIIMRTAERKDYFTSLVGLLGTVLGAMVGTALQELRVQDKVGDVQVARAVAAEASDAALVLQTQVDTLKAVIQRTPTDRPLSLGDVNRLRATAGVPRPRVPTLPETWRPVDRQRIP